MKDLKEALETIIAIASSTEYDAATKLVLITLTASKAVEGWRKRVESFPPPSERL